MIRFLFGDQGTGKSTWIYRYLTSEAEAHPERRYFLFVPEQNTLKAQQQLVRTSKRHGMLNLDVLSFQLLTYRVLDELNVKKPQILDDTLRSLLLRRAAGNVRKDLSVYRSKLGKPGFISQLKETFTEFCQYGVGLPELIAAGEGTDSELLSGKLSDLSLILSEYTKIREGFGRAPEEIPALLPGLLTRSKLLKGAVLCFDG
nr:ATP-dependent helicase [Clostridia bacterium]